MVQPGNGTIQLGLAGAGTAMAEDAAATLRNPAAGAWLDSGMTADVGIAIPDGGYTATPVGDGSNIGLLDISPAQDTSVEGVFPIPAFARNWRLDDRRAWGIGITAAGLKTLSRGNSATLARGIPLFEARCEGTVGGGSPTTVLTDPRGFCGASGSAAGIDLTQIFVSAHGAYRLRPDLAVGLAPVLAVQRLSLRGFGAFAAFSNFPEQTTDNGNAFSVGGGLRAGLLWEIQPGIGLGLAYQSRIYSTEMDRYRGAIIGGSLDLAPIYDLGLQIHFAPQQRLLIDVEHIAYEDIKPISARVEPQPFTDGCFAPRLQDPRSGALDACLGGRDGPGFGWNDMTIFKLGYEVRRGPLSLRAGYSYGHQPLGKGQIISAVVAPAVTEQHAALGLSWVLTPRLSFDWALIHALRNRHKERNALSSGELELGGSSALLGFHVDSDPEDQTIETYLGVWQSQFGLSWRFE